MEEKQEFLDKYQMANPLRVRVERPVQNDDGSYKEFMEQLKHAEPTAKLVLPTTPIKVTRYKLNK